MVLGTAAGGGLPQWNCRCGNCRRARDGGLKARFQSSIALQTEAGQGWALVNASPDLPRQIESFLSAQADDPDLVRASPIAEVFLTNADLDHALGLLLLREGGRLQVTAPDGVRRVLGEQLGWDSILNSFSGIDWHDASPKWQPAGTGRLESRACPFATTGPPRFAPGTAGPHGVGYLFRERDGDQVVGIFPDVAELDATLQDALRECTVVFFDGTFWQDDEMSGHGISDRTARQMGHVPIADSLPHLAPLAAEGRRIFYLHLNNTNAVLDPASAEHQAVAQAGLTVAGDGLRLTL